MDSETRKPRGRPRAWDDKTEQNTIKSLARAMDILAYLSENQGLSLTELAEDLGQSPATVYRVLITLENKGLLEFDPATQLWHIGAGAFIIGARFLRRTSLLERARPILRSLMEETGETANLGIERDGQVLFVSQVETTASIRAFFPPGTLSPMHSSGIGKALLSRMDDVRQRRIIAAQGLEAFTSYTLTEPKPLIEDLRISRARGYAIDDEEKNEGMRCIAAPVFDMNDEAVAGISVSGPTSRVSHSEIEAFSRPVMEAAEALTHAIGGAL